MKLKTIVIDDEPFASQLIESYVLKTPFLEHIATFSTAIEAISSNELKSADLLFLDIQMPNLTGLEFSRMIEGDTRIIFTTAFNEYALDGYKVNALDYLLKPISYVDFLEAAQKAASWFDIKNRAEHNDSTPSNSSDTSTAIESIYVKSEYKLLRIELSDLLYVEGLKDYVKFYTESSSKPILSLMNLKKAEDILPSDQFIRVHRSYIVRKDKIRVIERNQIIFDKVRIPIGESYKSQLGEYLKLRSI
ncbi:MAG: LytTR family DNA-binding domain-containing protein [Rikenellaceae bacterium]